MNDRTAELVLVDVHVLHDVRPEHVETHELLRAILAELAALRAEVRELRPASNGAPPEGDDIVALIAACCGGRAFNAGELIDHCRLPAAAAYP